MRRDADIQYSRAERNAHRTRADEGVGERGEGQETKRVKRRRYYKRRVLVLKEEGLIKGKRRVQQQQQQQQRQRQ
jgi:hypothetical protein